MTTPETENVPADKTLPGAVPSESPEGRAAKAEFPVQDPQRDSEIADMLLRGKPLIVPDDAGKVDLRPGALNIVGEMPEPEKEEEEPSQQKVMRSMGELYHLFETELPLATGKAAEHLLNARKSLESAAYSFSMASFEYHKSEEPSL